MHAQVVTADFTDAELAIKGLDELVPNVKATPGFVTGYWIRLDDSHGTSVVMYDTEDHARAAAPPVGDNPMGGVRIASVQFGEVMGSA